MELYLFLRQLKFKIQIFYSLWKVLVIRMTDQIVREGNRWDASVSILCFESFIEDGYFNLKLLNELAGDLKKTWSWCDEPNNVNEEKQINAKKAINRFRKVVLERMETQLRANNIKFK
ncbi:hypothetical protein Ocin01_20035 [Orchesella cincta]|uniref:Uncharacterized protein n=1 Tax=Orchesella cincta TaxID=48709 RepID=A0A1D2M102_ORCCI|nr:hypothetical protein Ocin01_20035 [Orchesella cincta]